MPETTVRGTVANVEDLWLDTVLAVPALGVQLNAPPSVLFGLREVVGPSLDQLAALSDLEVAQASVQGNYELRISGKDGYTHKVVQLAGGGGCHATVDFTYTPRETKTVGQLPMMSFHPRPYAEIVKECLRRADILTESILRQSGVSIARFGLAARCELAESQLPPGLLNYRDWSEGPWLKRGASIRTLQSTVLTVLSHAENSLEQCHHSMAYERGERDTEYKVLLDYQRVFSKHLTRNLRESAEFAVTAMEYFQSFAFPADNTEESVP